MGIFKDNLNLDLQYAFLINLGFKYEESNGINGMSGYVKSINHNETQQGDYSSLKSKREKN